MSLKLTHEQASKIMRKAKLEPVEEYPGNKEKWKCKCLQCGKTVYPTFGSIRNGQGGCRDCGLKRGTSSRRLDEKMTVEVMKKAGVVPLEPYVSNSKPWRSKCKKCKREVSPSFGNVKNGHAACVYCAGKKVHPDDAVKIMKKAGLEPLVPYPGSNTRWKCRHITCGEIVFPTQSSIVQGGGGCQKCGDIKTREKQMHSDKDARELFLKKGLDPQVPYPGAGKPWKSKCRKCKQIVSPTYGSIQSGTGCGVCAGKIVTEELAIKVMKKARLKPLVPYPGSKKNWKCLCIICGKTVFPNYGDVNQGDGGCKYCGGHFVEPEAAMALMIAANIKPLTPYTNAGTNWESICLVCNKSINPSYNSVQQRGSGCKYCAKKFIDPEDAIKIMLKAKLQPLVSYPGSQLPWKCKCLRCNREVQPALTSIQSGQKGCVYCGGKKVDPEEAFQLMLSAGLTPLEIYKGADLPWRCTCNKCGKFVTPRYSAIRSGQGGCRYCTNKGLDYNAPAFLYLMTNSRLGAHKVGIGNHKTRNNRINEHKKTGWVLIQNMDFQTGDLAFQIEQETLIWLREVKKLGVYLSKNEMPQGGETETVDASEIDLPTIWAKVEALSKVKK